tara:strand:+ start:261 stop:476 length:216 start_codon:yes stop_codon:yes gene_type:complete
MAKTSAKNRRRNARRKQRELRAAMRGEATPSKVRNQVVLGMILRGQGAGNHGDARKEASRKACRGKWKGDQ